MEVIEIGKTQLIFVLDKNDMTKYSINTDNETPILRDGFSRLVIDMGVGYEFLTGVLVQIFDSENGGCEMFVTKIPDSITLQDPSELEKKKYIYIFKNLSDLLSACKMLSSTNEITGKAYTDKDKSAYYLLLEKESKYLGEFNGKKCKEGTLGYLFEHCSLLCDNAVSVLAPLA